VVGRKKLNLWNSSKSPYAASRCRHATSGGGYYMSTISIISKKYMRYSNNLPHTCYIKSKSYTHNHLKRFIALQNLTSVVQRLHPFTTPTGRTRNGRITKGHASFLWMIDPMANMKRQSSADGNFKERGRRAVHDNAGDLRRTLRKGSTSSRNDSPFPQEGVPTLPFLHHSH
jgi:hypothetical protein